MFKRWLCLLLVLAIGCASLSFAEELAIDVDSAAGDVPEDALVIEELPEDIDVTELDIPELSLSEDEDGLLLGEAQDLDVSAVGDVAEIVNESEPSLTLNYQKLLIGIKEKTTYLKATRSPKDAGDTVTWTSDNTSVAKVDKKSGKLTGVAKGTANITAKTASGLTASCAVTVRKAPGSVTVTPTELTLSVGDTYTVKGKLPSGKGSTLAYTSANKKIATVGKQTGVVTAVAVGSTTIAVKTFNGHSAKCKLTVVAAPKQVFLPESVTILLKGNTTVKATAVDEAGNEVPATFTYKTKKGTGKITVNAKTGKIVGKTVGTATLYATAHNGVSTHVDGGMSVQTVCNVKIVEAPDRVELAAEEVTVEIGKTCELKPRVLADDGSEIAGTAYTVSSSDESILKVSAEGVVEGLSEGSATVTVTAVNGVAATCNVTVVPSANPVSYRLFAAYSYYDSLPFVKRNANGMANVFKRSNVDGQGYATKVMGNASKAKILSGISSFFADADDNDVSIVYLCSHGHNNKSSYTSYRLSLMGYDKNKSNTKYYLTSKEIFNSIQAINGNVILILDSCYSGTFINDMKSKLSAEDGRIAVLTAASNTRATYYNSKSKSVDFFTFFLLQGLGYNEKESWWNKNSSGDKGSFPGYFSADKKGNGDGSATLAEFYNFASNCIAVNIPKYMKKSWYWGDSSQVQKPRFYAGNLKELVIYRPEQ